MQQHKDGRIDASTAMLAFGLPFVLEAVLVRIAPGNPAICWLAPIAPGCLFLTRGYPIRTRILIALGYLPFMLAALVFASSAIPFLAVRFRI
mgnify:CR=1 FL=1